MPARTISVVIPTYNRGRYINYAIDSVLDQRVPHGYQLEVLIIDDGSTDNTSQLVEKYSKRITYKRILGSGRPAVPRNIGIRLAKGELIAFQDSDDIWAEDKLIKQLPAFEDPQVVLAYGNAEFMDEDGRRTGRTVITPEQVHSGDIFKPLLENNFISTLTVITRKNIIERAGYFNESLKLRGTEDYELWLRISLFGKVKYIDEILSYYRTHEDNISSKDPYTSYRRLVDVFWNTSKLQGLSRAQKKEVMARLARAYEGLALHAAGKKAIYSKINKKIINLRSRLI